MNTQSKYIVVRVSYAIEWIKKPLISKFYETFAKLKLTESAEKYRSF